VKSGAKYLWILFRFKVKRGGIDAVAHTSFVARAVFEEVAQMGIAPGANYLDPLHSETGVITQLDIALTDHVPETGPARSGMELGIGREQVVAAGGANVHAILFGIDVFTSKRPFCPRFAQDMVLVIAELLSPLLFCFGNFFPNSLVGESPARCRESWADGNNTVHQVQADEGVVSRCVRNWNSDSLGKAEPSWQDMVFSFLLCGYSERIHLFRRFVSNPYRKNDALLP
jgi:hypothetical protein